MDWSALKHAHGPADEVPAWIRALYAQPHPEADSGELVLDELVNSINHQGSIYSATVAAVPFLAHLAMHVDFHRVSMLYLLTRLAGDPEGDAEEVPVGSEREPLARPLRAAVVAELPTLTRFLHDPAPIVRQQAIRMCVVAPRPADPFVHGALGEISARDPDPWTRADALTALALLDDDEEAVRRREIDALTADTPEVRLSAALLVLERARPPFPAAVVDVLAVDGARDLGFYWATGRPQPFPHPGPPDGRLGELLLSDPQAALTVAEAWIAAGDLEHRGSHLADEVGAAWRDREPRILAALAGALSLPRAVADDDRTARISHAWLLRQLAAWMPRAGDPGRAVRNMLLDEAGRGPTEASARAQLALAHCGDLRLLEQDVPPTGPALGALLTHHGPTVPELLHRALEEHLPQGDPTLLDALTPLTARSYARHVAEAFRNRPTTVSARLLGAIDPTLVDDTTLNLLAAAGRESTRDVLRATAVVSHARLTGRPATAVALLSELLAGDSPEQILRQAGLLGTLGQPLATQILELLPGLRGIGRAAAADAYWRVIADPGPVVPLLVELAQPGRTPHPGDSAWHRLDALRTLAEIGTTPPELLPLLRTCAHSPRRVARADRDEHLRQVATSLLAQAG